MIFIMCSVYVAQFIVHERGHGIVALQNVKNPASWLAIRNGELTTVR